MSLRFRQIIFFVFLALFAITAPTVLFVTSGYRYNFKKARVEKTGILRIDSLPKNATVFVNEEPQKNKTPLQISRLLPDEYTVRVEKEGYTPWQKTLGIQSGITTFAREVVLFKTDIASLVRQGDIRSAAISKDGLTIVALRNTNGLGEIVSARKTDTSWTVMSRLSEIPLESAFTFSPNERFVLFTATTATGQIAQIFSLTSATSPGDTMNIPQSTTTLHWAPSGATLVATTPAAALFLAPTTKTTTSVPQKNLEDVSVEGRIVYEIVRRANDVLVQTVLAGTPSSTPKILTTLPPGTYRFLTSSETVLALADETQKKILFLNKNDGTTLISLIGESIAWDPSTTNRVLVWNNSEVNVVDLRAQTRSLVTRVSTPIRSCVWHPSGNAILFSTSDSIFATELDNRDKKNTAILVRGETVSAFVVDTNATMLFFVGVIQGEAGVFEKGL